MDPCSEAEARETARYRIQVRGQIGPERGDWFAGMEAASQPNQPGGPLTTLVGPIPDQAALHGILNRLHALGLILISVQRLEKGE
jgi:hypothetical protein